MFEIFDDGVVGQSHTGKRRKSRKQGEGGQQDLVAAATQMEAKQIETLFAEWRVVGEGNPLLELIDGFAWMPLKVGARRIDLLEALTASGAFDNETVCVTVAMARSRKACVLAATGSTAESAPARSVHRDRRQAPRRAAQSARPTRGRAARRACRRARRSARSSSPSRCTSCSWPR